MTAPTVFAAVSLAPQAHHLAAAEVYIRACHADRHLTQGRVAELAHALASRPEWQQAIDSDRAELLAMVDEARAAIREHDDSLYADGESLAAVLGKVRAALFPDELEACIARHPAGRKLTDH